MAGICEGVPKAFGVPLSIPSKNAPAPAHPRTLRLRLFLIVEGATTVQFNAGSPSRMNVSSTGVDLWSAFLFITAASGLGALIGFIVCAFKKTMQASIPPSIASFSLSALAFFTLASYFPSA